MQALWFLTWRLLVNSLRRTLRHPVRAFVFLLVVGWFGLTMGGNLFIAVSTRMRVASHLPADWTAMNMDNLMALVIAAHLAMLWQPLTPWIGSTPVPLFTRADVHFLFPTPQKRLWVFLFLLLTRGMASSLFTLLVLVFVVLALGYEFVADLLAGSHPPHLTLSWAYPLMYLLAFVSLLICGILITLQEERQAGFRRRLSASVWTVIAVMAGILVWHGYRAWRGGYEPLQEVVWHVLDDPVLVAPLLPLRGLAEAALIFYNGWTPFVTAGFLLWGGFAVTMLWLLIRQEDRLYDLAVQVSALTATYTLRRQSPAQAVYDSVVAYAASSKGRVPRWRLFERWAPEGVWALLWCHSLLLMRMVVKTLFSWFPLLAVAVALLIFFLSSADKEGKLLSPFLWILLYLLSFSALLLSQVVLFAAVRRIEMNRSLPFAVRHVIWMEILPPSILLWTLQTVAWGIFCYLLPQQRQTLTLHYLILFSAVPLWHAGLFLLYLMLPDQSDYTQRVLFGVLLFPLLFLLALPALLLWFIADLLSLPAVISTVMIGMGNILVTWAVVCIAGDRYMQVNPAE